MRTAAKRVFIGSSISVGLFLGYDYQTCHPMRKVGGYEPEGALTRFHNIVRQHILPMNPITLNELSLFDGKDGHPIYFSANGSVYDVSDSEMFKTAYSVWAGKDATVSLATMSLEPEDANSPEWHNLTEEELETLRSWTHYFNEKYIIKGHLVEFIESKTKPRQ
jgi:predicted heme/steroid binding protein